jgi:hypothetical protein
MFGGGGKLVKPQTHYARAGRPMSRRRSKARQAHSTRAPRGRPPHPRFAWYLGLTLMATLEVIEWPLAIVVGVGHEVLHRTHSRALQEMLQGMAAGR